jgi:signal transduction histidine kinase
MMSVTNDRGAPAAHRLARLLRHEVGDLLQSVYSTTAILLDRITADQSLERRLLGDLKQRAELCRLELDAALDLVSQPPPADGTLDLVPVLTTALAGLRARFPALRITEHIAGPSIVPADPRALNAALSMLLLAMGQGAKEEVRAELRPGPRQVELELRRDGFTVPAEQLGWLNEPFATTQQAVLGLALALTARAARQAGGEVQAESPREGGVCVRIQFPVHAAA